MDTVRAILLFFYMYFLCNISTSCYFQIPCFHFHITLFKQILKAGIAGNSGLLPEICILSRNSQICSFYKFLKSKNKNKHFARKCSAKILEELDKLSFRGILKFQLSIIVLSGWPARRRASPSAPPRARAPSARRSPPRRPHRSGPPCRPG